MSWHGVKFLLFLGRPWLLGLAMRAGRFAAIGLLGMAQRRRYARRLAESDPQQLAGLILPFLQRHGFRLERESRDEEGVLLAGTVAVEGESRIMLVRAQTAAAGTQERVLDALADAAGADGHALLIGAGEVPAQVRARAQGCGRALGVLDGIEFAGELVAAGGSAPESR